MKADTLSLSRQANVAVLALSLSTILVSSAMADEKQDRKLLRGHPVACSELKPGGRRWVKATILIQATPAVVWDAVHEERKSDPDLAYSKILRQEKNCLTLEQKFAFLPIIGTATCVMVNEEIPHQRIDYRLIESDHFKAMEGSWVLTPHGEGRATMLELSTYLDLGLPVPRPFMDGITSQKLQRRLTNVKNLSEKMQAQIAQAEKGSG